MRHGLRLMNMVIIKHRNMRILSKYILIGEMCIASYSRYKSKSDNDVIID